VTTDRRPRAQGAGAPSARASGTETIAADAPLAARAARAAGAAMLARVSKRPSGVRAKGDPRELVSDADLEADHVIRALLADARPGDAILTEEAPQSPGASGRRWIVDPLDGTTNYLTGLPYWCVSIALEDAGGPLLGTIYDPLRDELFAGGRGLALTVNGAPAGVRAVAGLAQALLAVHLSPRAIGLPEVVAVLDRALGVRETGSTALDLAWVAAGRLDGCLLRRTASVWDWAAGFELVKAGGGVVAPVPLPVSQATIAASPAVARDIGEQA